MLGYLAYSVVSAILALLLAKLVLPKLLTKLKFDPQVVIITQGITVYVGLIGIIGAFLNVGVDLYHMVTPF